MKNKKKVYITTPIYYPSANAHIGHAYCTVLTDVFARSKRIRGYDTYFLTGTDEHGEKIQKNAASINKTPQEFVDEIASNFKALWKELKISNDDFIRTTENRHIEVVQKVFSTLYKNDDIYLGNYEGWYCTPCESFWTDMQVGEEKLCPDCHRPVHKAKEEAYFFKTQKYLPTLLKYMDKNDKFVTPISRKNEMMNTFIKPGLGDLCISRTSFDWGVKIKENTKHVVYVWMDALTNYISALGYLSDNDELFKKFWMDKDTEIIHVVGADISRFHIIYWPMFLTGLGLRLPNRVFVHGLLDLHGEKISKSKGNVVSPIPLINRYGVDAVRWYLAREFSFGSDGKFTPELFVERINLDLANNLGNLVNRTLTMIDKYFDGIIPSHNDKKSEKDLYLKKLLVETAKEHETLMDDLKITEALAKVMNLLGAANKYIEESEPWTMAKNSDIKGLENVMATLSNVIVNSTIMLECVLVETAPKIYRQFGLTKKEEYSFDLVKNFDHLGGKKVNKESPLFPRLKKEEEVEFISSLSK